jgi:diguanylate cyclase (GGDEF)-like protein
VLLFPAAIHMALAFPSPLRLAERLPRLVWAPYGLAALLALVYQVGLHHPHTYVATHLTATLAMGAGLALLIASQVGRFLRPTSFEARQRVKVLALGTAGALAPLVILTLGSALSGGKTPQNLIAFTAFLFPLSIGYAVIRHNLLDVDVLIRRSLSYGVLTLVVTVGYAGSIALLDSLVSREASHSNAFAVGFALVCVGVLLPLRDRVQTTLDRIFFRTAYDFRRIVETTSARLAAVNDLSIIADELQRAVGSSLHPTSITLFARSEKNDALEETVHEGEPAAFGRWREFVESASGPFELESGHLVVPFRTPDLLVGTLILGRPQSGALYGGDDRRLLQTLANQGAVAMRNALALESLRELNRSLESKVEERTRKLKEANEQLRELSSTDLVTGLRTRRYVMEALEREFHRYQRSGTPAALIMLDLDHFKRVNDTFGHLAGDEALRRVGQLLKRSVRVQDTAGRYGGEEMMLVLSDAGREGAEILAERLRAGIEQMPVELPGGRTLELTVSLGVAVLGPQHRSAEDLIEAADAALYRAKESGRNRVEIAS